MYCTIDDIRENYIDENTLINLLDSENRSRHTIDLQNPEDPISKRIENAILDACAEIDPFLEPLGILPLINVPRRVKYLCGMITKKNIYQRNPSYSDELPEQVLEDYKRCIEDLRLIKSKKLSLGIKLDSPSASASSEVKVNKTEADQYFSASMLSRF